MPYIGNTPALDYISFAVQNFTVTAGTTVYTLDYSVSNENDIALYINSVAQRPGASFAYSATGTTLTLTSATLATDTMYAVFIGRAVQTVVPPANINLQLADGTAAAPSLNFANDTNTGIFRPTTDSIGFAEGGTEVMRITSDGNVGVNVTPSAISGFKILEVKGSTTNAGGILRSTSANGTYSVQLYTASAEAYMYTDQAIPLAFYNSGVERMRIDSSGNVIIGGTSSSSKFRVEDVNNRTESTAQFSIAGNGYNLFNWLDGTAAYIGQNSNSRSLRLYSGSSASSGVNLAAGGTSWGTYSDERLKYEIENINDAITKIKNIRCVSYKLKDVDTEISSKRLGVIAQSLVGKLDEVLDYSKKSEEDENKYISVRYSEIIPVLIKSIQEQQAIIEELKATTTSQQTKIDALEARLTTLENN
jgi:hypothetical protein